MIAFCHPFVPCVQIEQDIDFEWYEDAASVYGTSGQDTVRCGDFTKFCSLSGTDTSCQGCNVVTPTSSPTEPPWPITTTPPTSNPSDYPSTTAFPSTFPSTMNSKSEATTMSVNISSMTSTTLIFTSNNAINSVSDMPIVASIIIIFCCFVCIVVCGCVDANLCRRNEIFSIVAVASAATYIADIISGRVC